MKCNPNILRYILLEIEKRDDIGFDVRQLANNEYDGDTVTHHAMLLVNAGYLQGYRGDTLSKRVVFIDGITMRGYAFLDSIRDNRIWLKVLKELAKIVAPTAISSIEEIAKKIKRESDT